MYIVDPAKNKIHQFKTFSEKKAGKEQSAEEKPNTEIQTAKEVKQVKKEHERTKR